MILFGHRGAAGEAPENTIAGIQHALQCGLHSFEIDLRLSADRQLMLMHDYSLQRTTGIDKNIDELSSRQLAELTALGRNGEITPGVPTLQAVINQCPAIETLQLELKSDESTDKPALVSALCEFVAQNPVATNWVATSFDAELLAQVSHACPQLPIGLVSDKDTENSLELALSMNCRYLCLGKDLVDAWNNETITQLKDSGLHVSLWTVNDPELLEKLDNLPVHSIITDYPSVMAQTQQ